MLVQTESAGLEAARGLTRKREQPAGNGCIPARPFELKRGPVRIAAWPPLSRAAAAEAAA
jgi:hypothetical protein